MRPSYANFEWQAPGEALEAWRRGRTGYPLVDAAMRELLSTGYLQQNVRHTVGQFLVEILGIDWRLGEHWFHVALADSDLAINAMMWQHQGLVGVSQWLTGVDCHPVRHAKNVDPSGAYVRKWIPELAKVPLAHLHAPWQAPRDVLKAAGVVLGDAEGNYPCRIIDDVESARRAFLEQMRHCRAAAPDGCMGKDGCDMIASPTGSGPGIWALTERCFRSTTGDGGLVAKGSGKAKGKGGRGSNGGLRGPSGMDRPRADTEQGRLGVESGPPPVRHEESTSLAKAPRTGRWRRKDDAMMAG